MEKISYKYSKIRDLRKPLRHVDGVLKSSYGGKVHYTELSAFFIRTTYRTQYSSSSDPKHRDQLDEKCSFVNDTKSSKRQGIARRTDQPPLHQ
jgi:hypothetical protein